MTVSLANRFDITLDAVERAAWRGQAVRLAPAALARIGDCRAAFLRLIDDPEIVVYGVTSGYGQRAYVRFTMEERQRHARRPPFGSATAFGRLLPERVTRAIVLARLANFVEGHAAVTPALAAAVAAMLDGAPLPPVPWQGQGGAGEILALSPLFGHLPGELEMGEKEVLSLINGSPCAAALVADQALAGRRRADLAMRVMALSIEAFKAPLAAYDPALDGLWGDPHEAAALTGLRALLAGAGTERRAFQAPVSYRIIPRMLGRSLRALAAAEEAARVSLASVSDNPVFVPPDGDHPNGRVFSTGGYHNAMAWPALDELAAAAADLCLIAERHTDKLLNGRVSGLPDQLLTSATDDRYMGTLGMVQVGYGEQARHAAQRSFMPGPESGGYAQNDVAPPTFPAWAKAVEAGECLDGSLATLAIVASQALHITERPAPPALVGFLDEIRATFPPLERGYPLGADLGRLAARFTERIYSA